MVKRVCSGCGVITTNRRCPDCQRAYEAARPSRRAKGRYDAAYRKLRARLIREHPWCASCGAGDSPGNPLTFDHITPLEAGGTNTRANGQVLCRGCNSSKGARPVA